MYVSDYRVPDYAEVELWRVRGIDHWLYPTKYAAEVDARRHFPWEDPDARYARLSFVRYLREE